MNYDYDKIENILIQSIEEKLNLDNITGLSVLNLFNNHYRNLSLEQLYISKPIEKVSLPDGTVSVSVNDVFHYIDGKRKNAHRKLEFERHFYGYFEDEVVELRLKLYYKPLNLAEKDKFSFYEEVSFYQEKVGLLNINNNEWFEQIKNDRPMNYIIDVNFNA